MDLRDRRGGQWLGLEPGDRVGPEILAEDPRHLREREGRHVVHELARTADLLALMARVDHTVSLVGFMLSGLLALYLFWRIIRTPGDL